MKKILAYGELLWDLLPSGEVLGGATTNFIYRMNSFGDQGYLVSRLGDDDLGEKARRQVTGLGLSDKYIGTDPGVPTGTVQVVLDGKGTPDFTITQDVAYDYIQLTDDMLSLALQADCIYFGTLSQRQKTSANTLQILLKKTPQAVKFFDINLRRECYSTPVIMDSLQVADILKINDEELFMLKKIIGLTGNSLEELCQYVISKYRLRMVLVTLGEKGAFLLLNSGEYFYDPGYKVKTMDTVGAGDACSAGFMHYFLNNRSPEEALRFGNATGAKVATTKGGTAGITKDEIIRFMEAPHERVKFE